jgi:hypothetical protein
VSPLQRKYVQSNLLHYFNITHQHHNKTPEKLKNIETPEKIKTSTLHKRISTSTTPNIQLRQQTIIQYLSPQATLYMNRANTPIPARPVEQNTQTSKTLSIGPPINLLATSLKFESLSLLPDSTSSLHTKSYSSHHTLNTDNSNLVYEEIPAPKSRQTTLKDFFQTIVHPQIIQPQPKADSPIPPIRTAPSPGKCATLRTKLLKYSSVKDRSQTKITSYTTPLPAPDLQDSWGHSLATIDSSTTFRVFLQNPNGLSLSTTNYSLQQDFQTCRDYGTAAICLPETNTNWDLASQQAILHQILRQTWRNFSSQTSRAPESFLSQYQPGGTAITIICDNWVSRILQKGEDPIGLG